MKTVIKNLVVIALCIIVCSTNLTACDCSINDDGSTTSYQQILEEGGIMWQGVATDSILTIELNWNTEVTLKMYKLTELYCGDVCVFHNVLNLDSDSLVPLYFEHVGSWIEECWLQNYLPISDTMLFVNDAHRNISGYNVLGLQECAESYAYIENGELTNPLIAVDSLTTLPYNLPLDAFIDTVTCNVVNQDQVFQAIADTIYYEYRGNVNSWEGVLYPGLFDNDILMCGTEFTYNVEYFANPFTYGGNMLNDTLQFAIQHYYSEENNLEILEFKTVVCNEYGNCTSAPLIIYVDYDSFYVEDDFFWTANNIQIEIDPLGNDDLSGDYSNTEPLIVFEPSFGNIDFTNWSLSNPTLIYNPNSTSIFVDSFAYSICNNFVCDTAIVFIEQSNPSFVSELDTIEIINDLPNETNMAYYTNYQRNLIKGVNQLKGSWIQEATDNDFFGWYDQYEYDPRDFRMDFGQSFKLSNLYFAYTDELYAFEDYPVYEEGSHPVVQFYIEPQNYEGVANFINQESTGNYPILQLSNDFPLPQIQQFQSLLSNTGDKLKWYLQNIYGETDAGWLEFTLNLNHNYTIIQQGNHVNAQFNSKTLTYVADNVIGWEIDSISYLVCDTFNICSQQQLYFRNPENHIPSCVNDTTSFIINENVVIEPIINDYDVDGDIIMITDANGQNFNTSIIGGSQIEIWSSNLTTIGEHILTYTVCDEFDNCCQGNIVVEILPCTQIIEEEKFYEITVFGETVDTILSPDIDSDFYELSYYLYNNPIIEDAEIAVLIEYPYPYSPNPTYVTLTPNSGFLGNIEFIVQLPNDNFDCFVDNHYFNINVIPDTTAIEEKVWPGDTDSDGMAHNIDLLHLGLSYGKVGATRDAIEIDWEGKDAQNWLDEQNGLNGKHADCNGDGMVDELDVEAIYQNYDLTHSMALFDDVPFQISSDYPSTAGTIYLDYPNDTIYTATEVQIPIYLEGPNETEISQAYGVAFTLHYDTSLVVEGSAYIDFSDGWLAPSGSNISISKDFYQAGKIDAAVSRIDQNPISGTGIIGYFVVVIIDNLDGKREIDIPFNVTVEDVYSVNSDESRLIIEDISFEVVVAEEIVLGQHIAEQNEITISPNPTLDYLKINNGLNIESITVYDISGKDVFSLKSSNTIDVSQLKPGVYILELNSNNEKQYLRFIKK